MTRAAVLEGWRSDEAFRASFIGLLARSPLDAYRWETPALTSETLARSFEYVLVEEPALVHTAADPSPFDEHIAVAGGSHVNETVVRFANLRRDAMLIVPREIGSRSAYGHLAAFARGAPLAQQHALWQAVGEAMLARVGADPVWLSTAGLGVPWLHVRLDDRPKYYSFAPYRPVTA